MDLQYASLEFPYKIKLLYGVQIATIPTVQRATTIPYCVMCEPNIEHRDCYIVPNTVNIAHAFYLLH